MVKQVNNLYRNDFAMSHLQPFLFNKWLYEFKDCIRYGMRGSSTILTAGHNKHSLLILHLPFLSLAVDYLQGNCWLLLASLWAVVWLHYVKMFCIPGQGEQCVCFISLTVQSNLNWNRCELNSRCISADYLDRKNIGRHKAWHKCSLKSDCSG